MKSKIIFSIFILMLPLLMSNGGGPKPVEKEYVSFPMINSEIRNTLAEHETQKELKKENTINLGVEKANRGLWKKYKDTTKKIQDRLRIVDFAIQSIPTGYAMYLEAEEIKKTQNEIIAELNDAPYALIVAVPDQIKFVDELQMVIRLLVGIVASYGSINQMEKADRKQLLDYALEEVKLIKWSAWSLLDKIIDFKILINTKKNILKYYIDRDKTIIKDIINNVKKI